MPFFVFLHVSGEISPAILAYKSMVSWNKEKKGERGKKLASGPCACIAKKNLQFWFEIVPVIIRGNWKESSVALQTLSTLYFLLKKKKIYFKLSMEQKDIQHTYYKCLSSVSAAICHCVYFEMDGVYSPFFFFPPALELQLDSSNTSLDWEEENITWWRCSTRLGCKDKGYPFWCSVSPSWHLVLGLLRRMAVFFACLFVCLFPIEQCYFKTQCIGFNSD